MTCPIDDAVKALADGLRPDPMVMVSEWADQFRVLSSRESAEPGPWRTSRTPYLKEPLDSLSRLDPVQEVAIIAGAQIGKTASGLCWIGATIDGTPGPMLCVQPRMEDAKKFSKQRITPLIEETECLRKKVKSTRERDGGNTMLSKEYPGGILMLTGANSAAGLRSMPIRDLFLDEIDAYPGDVDGEGDPVDLAIARTRTFARRKVLMTSTPTVAGTSRIWNIWEHSDQRVYKVPCPDCGHKQLIEWERIRYDAADWSVPARLACEACGVLIDERHKTKMLAAGEWVPMNAGAKVRGFHVSSLYSPLGWFSWSDAAQQYEKSKGDDHRMRVFTNTVLGQPWQEKGEAPAWEALYRRREGYELGVVPDGGMILTAGCDVQHNRLEVEVVAWGPNLESWSVLYEVFEGRTGTIQMSETEPCPWRELGQLLNREFPTASGSSLPITRMAVDSGDQTAVVYEWIRSQHDSRLMATKGRDQQIQLVGMPSSQDVTVRGRKIVGGIKLWPLGVSTGKRELYNWLRQDAPLDPAEPLPRGWCHFPDAYGEDFFQGLTAEELQVVKVRGFPKWQWVKVRARNEQLDCRVMARAALATLGADRWDAEKWSMRAEKVGVRVKARQSRQAAVVDGVVDLKKKRPGGWLDGSGSVRRRGKWL
jgi:phage terminase large subunit GpA-like protein